jgi:hypothetical protein
MTIQLNGNLKIGAPVEIAKNMREFERAESLFNQIQGKK